MTGAGLCVAVLGPSVSVASGLGGIKRSEIRTALLNDGHRAFFPEEVVSAEKPFTTAIEQERTLLAASAVDLVIVLYTSTSVGAAVELGNFVSVPEIKAKTAVLFPIEYYTPNDALVANTVRDYFVKMPYAHSHLENCQIVAECRKWANDMASGNWVSHVPHSF